MNSMKIEIATNADLPQILRYDFHIPAERLTTCIVDKVVYVLRDGDEIVGVLRYSLFWQTLPFLDLLYIDETYRRIGYGSMMMAHWEAEMRRAGYRYAMLSTQEDEEGKFFYEKIGYTSNGSFLPPEQDVPELIYWKEL